MYTIKRAIPGQVALSITKQMSQHRTTERESTGNNRCSGNTPTTIPEFILCQRESDDRLMWRLNTIVPNNRIINLDTGCGDMSEGRQRENSMLIH